ncbi:MAG TPA: STT3 domain-containing protein [Thermoanaerobaculia bacterium]|nr:STT3 domain-containing protein [Thermoanaerobaculia bacterium]
MLGLICAAALGLRVIPPWGEVFRDGRVVFAENDPWIHVRSAENIAAHWPLPSWFDPYRLAPGGQWNHAPLMDVAIAAIALATPVPLEVVAAWFPAVCGALVPIPLFFLTRRLFGTPEALLAAMLIAILPGSFLRRSLLGVADHHVMEVLFAVMTLLFLARALEMGRDREAVLAGLMLGLYQLSWARGAFLLLILIAWAMIEIAAGSRVARLLAIAFGVALLITAPVAVHIPSMHLSGGLLLGGTAAFLVAERMPRKAVLPFAALLLGAALLASPDLLQQLRRFLPEGGPATIGEVKPFLMVQDRLSLRPLWLELTTASLLAPIGFVLAAREWTPARRLLMVWSLAVTAATMLQGRFAYYMAAAAAVFAAVGAVRLLWRELHRAVAVAAVAAIVIYPNLFRAQATASGPLYGPPAAWLQVLDWIRVQTPEPFGSAEAYFERFTNRNAPEADYSIMAASEYGWWISRIARRPPATNPTHVAVREAAAFYTATTEEEAVAILAARKSRYVIVDRSFPMTIAGAGRIMSSQLEPMAIWAGKDPSRFYELVWENGRPLFLYHPDYYRTMGVRLFGYDGKAWTPAHSSWAVAVDGAKNLLERRLFATYEEAAAFVEREPGRWRLVGLHPIQSSVPLEPLSRFSRVHASDNHAVKLYVVK